MSLSKPSPVSRFYFPSTAFVFPLPLPTTTSTPLFTFTPLHSAPTASSIHLHVVTSTRSRTKSSNAFAPGAPSRIASAPMRGMCRAPERRDSVDVASGTRRVACKLDWGVRVERWMSVGRCACAGERDGFGCVRRTMLICLGESSCSLISASSGDVSIVDGAHRAARASRWRVAALMPMRICLPISGGGGGGSDVADSSSLFLFLFLPLEGSMCVLRWSPSGARRLTGQHMSLMSLLVCSIPTCTLGRVRFPGRHVTHAAFIIISRGSDRVLVYLPCCFREGRGCLEYRLAVLRQRRHCNEALY
jgi:hypothetical protein